MKKLFFLFVFNSIVGVNLAQLNIDNGVFFIGSGATVTVEGYLTSNVDITGTGVLQLKGSAIQDVDMGGNTIPNLEIDNAANARLINTGARIGNSLLFTNGKMQTGNFNLAIAPAATITGANTNRFVWTNGTGELRKELTADIASYELPVGENTNYRPAYLTTAGSAYASASVGVRVLGTASPASPPMAASLLKTYWPTSRTGITGGVVTLAGQYIDPTDVVGTESSLVGYYHNGADWSSAGEAHNTATNRVSAPITSSTGTISGINKFLTVGARAYLQGAYSTANGLMADNLRLLPFGSSASTNNFPSTDPYRVAPYNTSFTHVNNTAVETIGAASVLDAVGTDNDIVDWVFLELRNLVASPGNTVLQTRSALIQRDGDIVDVDGVSPVTFNNLANGNYILAIRHRNHLGLSIDQTSPRAINETGSAAFTTNVIDLRTATDPQLFGTSDAYTTASHPTLTNVNLLWGGDVSGNSIVRYQGSNGPSGPNDRVVLLQALSNVEANVFTGYYRGDISMNRILRYQGSNGPTGPNDRVVLLQILGTEATIRSQSLPN